MLPTPIPFAFNTQVLSYDASLSPMFDFQHEYPSPALPYLPSPPVEELAAHSVATRIIAAASQIMSVVQNCSCSYAMQPWE
jgi:hypothetical protein